jgi:hypothetical protein
VAVDLAGEGEAVRVAVAEVEAASVMEVVEVEAALREAWRP